MSIVMLVGCSPSPDSGAAGSGSAPEEFLLIPYSRVGRFTIGRDTRAEILGNDLAEARARFAEQGLRFEFEDGATLSGVNVSAPAYATREGLRVGTPADDVKKVLGKTKFFTTHKVNGKDEVAVLGYPGIAFVLANGAVSSIRVGED